MSARRVRLAEEPYKESTLEDELALALEAKEKGDHKHALHHLIGAVGRAPLDTRWQAPLADTLEQPGTLDVLEQDEFWAGQAAWAWWQHQHGQLSGAIATIGAVISTMPHLGLQSWLAAWVREALASKNDAACSAAIGATAPLTRFGVGRIALLPGEVEAARRFVPLCDALFDVALATNNAAWGRGLASAYRRAGMPEKAAQAARLGPPGALLGQLNQIALGLALRASRHSEAAVQAFEAAFAAEPDATCLLEIMRTHADAGAWKSALEAAHRAKPPPPEVEWEQQTQREIRFVETALRKRLPPPSVPPLDSIRRRSLGHAEEFHAADATANLLRNVASKTNPPTNLRASGKLDVTVSNQEGPSVRVCLALMVRGTSDPTKASYRVSTRNPNEARELSGGPMTLWASVDGVLVQAVEAAPAHVNAYVEELARTPRDFLDLWDAMASSAKGRPRASAREWLGAMLHPTMPLHQVGAGVEWVFKCQTVAAIGLANCETTWDESDGRLGAFISLMRGPDDWTKAAAIKAFAELAMREPQTTDAVRDELIRLTYNPPAAGHFTCAWPLLGALSMLPLVPPPYLEKARSLIPRPEEGDGDVVPANEAPMPPKRWWEFWKASPTPSRKRHRGENPGENPGDGHL